MNPGPSLTPAKAGVRVGLSLGQMRPGKDSMIALEAGGPHSSPLGEE